MTDLREEVRKILNPFAFAGDPRVVDAVEAFVRAQIEACAQIAFDVDIDCDLPPDRKRDWLAGASDAAIAADAAIRSRLTANARSDIPVLLAELDRLSAENAKMRNLVEGFAVVRCVGVPRNGDEFPNGLLCQICDSECGEGEKLQHCLSCPLCTALQGDKT